jgi:phosphopantothenoylcysteine synthetase/decarboxylase
VSTAAAGQWVSDREGGSGFRGHEAPKPARPDAVVVCPMTFNTANKWMAGIADSLPLSLLCEALGARVPIVAVPFINESLWAHPGLSASLEGLARVGVAFVDAASGDHKARPLRPGSGHDLAKLFQPAWIVAALHG